MAQRLRPRRADWPCPPARAASSARVRAGPAGALPVRARAALIARYYVLTNASIALGLFDWLRHGTEAGWTPPEGTR